MAHGHTDSAVVPMEVDLPQLSESIFLLKIGVTTVLSLSGGCRGLAGQPQVPHRVHKDLQWV